MCLVLLSGCYRPFFGRLPFDMSYWSAGFPAAAVAASSMMYHMWVAGLLHGRLAGSLGSVQLRPMSDKLTHAAGSLCQAGGGGAS